MPVVKLEPSDEFPVPFDIKDEEVNTFADALASVANTAELMVALGAPVEADASTLNKETALLDEAIAKKTIDPLKTSLPAAIGASSFLRAYGQTKAMDVITARTAITNKLFELADCGDPKYELKALELLGKHSDIGLFTERSEINVKYENPEALQKAILDRVKRIMQAEVVDEPQLGMNLDEELGILDADFTEVLSEAQEQESDDGGTDGTSNGDELGGSADGGD